MTRPLPARVETVGARVDKLAGSYLHSVTTGPWAACEVCAAPIDPGYVVCNRCHGHQRSGWQVADRVGLLVYADERSQTYKTMRGYKEPATRARSEPLVQALLAVGLRAHVECATTLAGTDDTGWAVVPSSRGRTVLCDLVRGLTRQPEAEIEFDVTDASPQRALNPDSWSPSWTTYPPEHVLVVDDSWVTGASAQSVAAALKRGGVEQVSVLAVARVLKPDWGPNQPFLDKVLPTLPYDWRICPWTRGECP